MVLGVPTIQWEVYEEAVLAMPATRRKIYDGAILVMPTVGLKVRRVARPRKAYKWVTEWDSLMLNAEVEWWCLQIGSLGTLQAFTPAVMPYFHADSPSCVKMGLFVTIIIFFFFF